MTLSKGALTAILSLTCVALAIAAFMGIVWQVQLLTETNQLIHLLGALVSAALGWLYLRCLITLID